ncbi:retrotransposon protein [Cucumis melo var. makuwa]|nr:retrotransposon protein [Cucumis melo var. makuwa]
MNDNKRIIHVPHSTRHRIRQLAYFHMIHENRRCRRDGGNVPPRIGARLLRLHDELLKKPQLVTNSFTDPQWRWFENCLGALDDIYIKVSMMASDRPSWLGRISCRLEHPSRCHHKTKWSEGYYCLCDTGYPNAESFLAPYKGKRYHLQGDFGLLKDPCAILRGKSYYPVKVQTRTILACCLLHNLINREMTNTNILEDVDEGDSTYTTTAGDDIYYIETSNEWSQWRDKLAESHLAAKDLLNKSFPHYDDLCYFWSDRATEEHVETFADVGLKMLGGYKGFLANDGNHIEILTDVQSRTGHVA